MRHQHNRKVYKIKKIKKSNKNTKQTRSKKFKLIKLNRMNNPQSPMFNSSKYILILINNNKFKRNSSNLLNKCHNSIKHNQHKHPSSHRNHIIIYIHNNNIYNIRCTWLINKTNSIRLINKTNKILIFYIKWNSYSKYSSYKINKKMKNNNIKDSNNNANEILSKWALNIINK